MKSIIFLLGLGLFTSAQAIIIRYDHLGRDVPKKNTSMQKVDCHELIRSVLAHTSYPFYRSHKAIRQFAEKVLYPYLGKKGILNSSGHFISCQGGGNCIFFPAKKSGFGNTGDIFDELDLVADDNVPIGTFVIKTFKSKRILFISSKENFKDFFNYPLRWHQALKTFIGRHPLNLKIPKSQKFSREQFEIVKDILQREAISELPRPDEAQLRRKFTYKKMMQGTDLYGKRWFEAQDFTAEELEILERWPSELDAQLLPGDFTLLLNIWNEGIPARLPHFSIRINPTEAALFERLKKNVALYGSDWALALDLPFDLKEKIAQFNFDAHIGSEMHKLDLVAKSVLLGGRTPFVSPALGEEEKQTYLWLERSLKEKGLNWLNDVDLAVEVKAEIERRFYGVTGDITFVPPNLDQHLSLILRLQSQSPPRLPDALGAYDEFKTFRFFREMFYQHGILWVDGLNISEELKYRIKHEWFSERFLEIRIERNFAHKE